MCGPRRLLFCTRIHKHLIGSHVDGPNNDTKRESRHKYLSVIFQNMKNDFYTYIQVYQKTCLVFTILKKNCVNFLKEKSQNCSLKKIRKIGLKINKPNIRTFSCTVLYVQYTADLSSFGGLGSTFNQRQRFRGPIGWKRAKSLSVLGFFYCYTDDRFEPIRTPAYHKITLDNKLCLIFIFKWLSIVKATLFAWRMHFLKF